jgi:hypothetical protein
MERKVLTAALAPGAGCLSMEELGRYADGTLGTPEQAAAATHVRSCLNCQAELALRQAVTSGSVRPGEADVVREGVARLEQRATEIFGAGGVETSSRRPWLRLGMLPVLAMAAAALVVAGGLYLRMGKAPELPRRVASGDEVTRSLAVAVRGPVGDQTQAPRRLEWLAVDRAVRYRVRLMEVDRREVWSADTAALEVDLPSSARASFAPGRRLLWEVTAYDGAGAAIAQSGPQSFRLVPR